MVDDPVTRAGVTVEMDVELREAVVEDMADVNTNELEDA